MEDKKQTFLNELVSLLRGHTVPCISNDARADAFCEWAVIQLIKLFNKVNKLHIFPTDFNLSDYVYNYLEYPLKRIKENANNPWIRDKVIIGFMGHWATGKTTALNTLFEESFFTNRGGTILNTYLTYGTNDKLITIVDRVGMSQELSLDQCSLFYNSNSNCNFPFERVFNYIVRENNSKLLNKLTILDTPGLFGLESDITTKVLPCCDVIFWFVNITISHLTYDEIRVLKESLQGKPVYIVFTFVDAVGMKQDMVDSSITSIVAILQKEAINYKGYLKLGKREQTQLQFKESAVRILTDISNEYEVYKPFNNILSSFDFLENHLTNYQLCFSNQFLKNSDISIGSQKNTVNLDFNYDNNETKMDLLLYNKISKVLSKTKRIKDVFISLLNESDSF